LGEVRKKKRTGKNKSLRSFRAEVRLELRNIWRKPGGNRLEKGLAQGNTRDLGGETQPGKKRFKRGEKKRGGMGRVILGLIQRKGNRRKKC